MTAVTAATPAVSRLRESRLHLRAIAVVIAAELVAWYAVLSRGAWAFDDNLFLGMARTQPLGSFVNADVFGHWAVGYKLADWLVARAMPIDYRWVLLVMLLVLGGSALLFARVVEMLIGGRWAPMLAAAYLAISVLLIRSMEWFSGGLQTVPTIACDVVCLWAYLRYQRQPAARWVLLSAGAIVVGLLFYEKALVMPVFILALRVLVQSQDLHPRAVVRGIWRERAIWAAYIAVVAAYVVARELAGASSVSSAGVPTVAQWLEMYWLMWSKSLVPAAFGLALTTGAYNGWQLAVGIALQLIVAGAIVVSIRRRSTAWRAWAALAACLLVEGILVGLGRVRMDGPGVATDQRYMIEFAWLIPLFVGLAFSSRPVIQPPGNDIAPASAPMRWTRRLMIVVAVVSVAYVAASVATAASWEDIWGGVPARAWETNVERGLAKLSRARARPVIADALAPGDVIQSSFVPFSYLSSVLSLYGPAPRVDGPLVGRIETVTADGHIVPARVARVIARVSPTTNCGRVGPSGIKLQERLVAPPVADGSYYLIVSYNTPLTANLPVYVDPGTGLAGAPINLVRLVRGATESIAWLGDGSPHGFLLSSPVGGYACLRGVELVSLSAGH